MMNRIATEGTGFGLRVVNRHPDWFGALVLLDIDK